MTHQNKNCIEINDTESLLRVKIQKTHTYIYIKDEHSMLLSL